MEVILNYLSPDDSIQEQVRKINVVSNFFGYGELDMADHIRQWEEVVNRIITYINDETDYTLPFLFKYEHIETWIDKTNGIINLIEQDYSSFGVLPPDLLNANLVGFDNERNSNIFEFSFRDNNENEDGHAIYTSCSPFDVNQRPLYPTFIIGPSEELDDYRHIYRGLMDDESIVGTKQYININECENLFFRIAAFRKNQVAFSDLYVYSYGFVDKWDPDESPYPGPVDPNDPDSVYPGDPNDSLINMGPGWVMTSNVYPFEDRDSMTLSSSVQYINVKSIYREIRTGGDGEIDYESFNVSSSVNSIVVRPLTQIYDDAVDNMQITSSVNNINVRTLTHIYDDAVDNMQITSSVNSVDVDRVVIEENTETEMFQVNTSVQSIIVEEV